LGSRGSVVPHFKRQIERGGPITLTDPKMTRFFMTISEAVHLVVVAGGFGRGGEVFVLKMGEPVRITDLAEDLIKLSGLTPDDIPIQYTGIRPGEKLTESLWEEGATTESTAHPDVLKVIEPSTARDADVGDIVRDFAIAAEDEDELRIQAMLVQLIPTFAPFVKMS
jgi:FlaA1/EpsC-like NDP-sugar epimerase